MYTTHVDQVTHAFRSAKGKMTVPEVALLCGITEAQARGAVSKLAERGAIEALGKVGGYMEYQIPSIRIAAPRTMSVFALPVYVPPKVTHRPVIEAPGCVVREWMTGRELT